MKAKRIYSQTKPEDVTGITQSGKEVTADDEWFDDVLRDWEHQGLDADLIYMARPLLSGNGRQQLLGQKFLANVRDRYTETNDAQMQLVALLGREGVSMGTVPHVSESDFNAAWDDMSGSAKRKGIGDFSFGHSDDTRRKAVSQDGNSPSE